MTASDRLDWGHLAGDNIWQQASGVCYFVGGFISVKELILALQEGKSVDGFLASFNQKITKGQVLAVMKFIQENTIAPIKEIFEYLENGRTVEEFLEFSSHTRAEVNAYFDFILKSLTA